MNEIGRQCFWTTKGRDQEEEVGQLKSLSTPPKLHQETDRVGVSIGVLCFFPFHDIVSGEGESVTWNDPQLPPSSPYTLCSPAEMNECLSNMVLLEGCARTQGEMVCDEKGLALVADLGNLLHRWSLPQPPSLWVPHPQTCEISWG